MGYRDDRIDERAEQALRRALARLDEPQFAAPPPDLVSRSARRLPSQPPAVAARQAAWAAWLRLAWRATLLALALLVVALGAAALFGGDWLALRFGDGSAGLSRTLLALQLLSKPLWRAFGLAGAPQLLALAVLFAGVAALWWWLARPAPQYAMERGP
ncbi:hypothetical protein [Kouleothrix sp.]|uniref:hypothetical protein n=1 Tax=Kouleothrix sp. TaxID=2779161 RepID=UPI00391D8E9F